eukprot:2675864-Rhodomonas_salina.1
MLGPRPPSVAACQGRSGPQRAEAFGHGRPQVWIAVEAHEVLATFVLVLAFLQRVAGVAVEVVDALGCAVREGGHEVAHERLALHLVAHGPEPAEHEHRDEEDERGVARGVDRRQQIRKELNLLHLPHVDHLELLERRDHHAEGVVDHERNVPLLLRHVPQVVARVPELRVLHRVRQLRAGRELVPELPQRRSEILPAPGGRDQHREVPHVEVLLRFGEVHVRVQHHMLVLERCHLGVALQLHARKLLRSLERCEHQLSRAVTHGHRARVQLADRPDAVDLCLAHAFEKHKVRDDKGSGGREH